MSPCLWELASAVLRRGLIKVRIVLVFCEGWGVAKLIVLRQSGLERKQILALTQVVREVIDFAPGRAVAKISGKGDTVFVKRFRRSMKPWWKRLFRKPYRSPIFDELEILSRLQALHYPSPEPLMYAESRHPRFHESILVTRFLPGVPLATLSGSDLLAGARLSLALLGRLHSYGIVHGDCNPYNFLIAEEAYVLDFERSGDFTEMGAIDDFKKIILRLRALGLNEVSLSEIALAYSDNVESSAFDVQAMLGELRDEILLAKPTRWRPPQELRFDPLDI